MADDRATIGTGAADGSDAAVAPPLRPPRSRSS